MKRIYNYRTNQLYEFESDGTNCGSTYSDCKRTVKTISESDDADGQMYKLCVREVALVDDVECDDDIEFDDRFDTIEDALAETDNMMDAAIDAEGLDSYEKLETDDEACVVYETAEKRYIFVVCLEDEEPDFEVEDEFEDEPVDDVDLDDTDFEDDLDVESNESVANRFSKLRRMFEAEEEESTEDAGDEESTEDTEDVPADTEDSADSENDEKEESTEEEEEEEMTAVAITVKTDDVDKCKEELIDAGVAEDDIEVLDDNNGETQIRIDVNSVMELKDYLAKKGIDLEEEIGGEIVSDEEGDAETGDGETGDGETDPDAEEEVPEFNLDDLGDIFGAEDGE